MFARRTTQWTSKLLNCKIWLFHPQYCPYCKHYNNILYFYHIYTIFSNISWQYLYQLYRLNKYIVSTIIIDAFNLRVGRERVEQIKQVVVRMLQYRRPAVVVSEKGHRDGLATGEIRRTGTTHGQINPGA